MVSRRLVLSLVSLGLVVARGEVLAALSDRTYGQPPGGLAHGRSRSSTATVFLDRLGSGVVHGFGDWTPETDVPKHPAEKLEQVRGPEHTAHSTPAQAGLLWRTLPVWVIAAMALDRIFGCWRLFGRGRLASTLQASRVAEVLAACAVYFVSGPALILLNRYIMKDLAFPFPITVSNLGNVCIWLSTQTLVTAGKMPLERKSLGASEYLRMVVPVAIFTSFSLMLGNWVYLYLSVPLIQILKSFTLVLVMLLGFVMCIERFDWLVVAAVVTMVVGLCLSIGHAGAAIGDEHATRALVWGLLIMFGANSAEAARAVFTQVSVDKLAFFDTLYWCSPAMLFVGAVFICIFEIRSMFSVHISSTPHLLAACFGSFILGGVVTLSNFWLIQLCGGLSLKVLVNARNIGLVLFSVMVLGEPCSAIQCVGYSLVLIGIGAYDRARQWQAEQDAVPGEEDTLVNNGRKT